MATPNIVPRANNEGSIGKAGKQWLALFAQTIYQNGGQVANLNSPAFTGTPTAPTPVTGDNSTKVATTAYVHNLIASESIPTLEGVFADTDVAMWDTAIGGLVSAGTKASFLSRANHTGTQANTTVAADATLAYGGSTLSDDLQQLNLAIGANAAAIAALPVVGHTHPTTEVEDSGIWVGNATLYDDLVDIKAVIDANVAAIAGLSPYTHTHLTTQVGNSGIWVENATLYDDLVDIEAAIAANLAAIGGKADTLHSHTSNDISDATAAAIANTVVKRGASGQAAFDSSALSTSAVVANASVNADAAFYGIATSSAAALIAEIDPSGSGYGLFIDAYGVSPTLALIKDNGATATSFLKMTRGLGSQNVFDFRTDGSLRMHGTPTNYTSITPDATGIRSIALPAASGTLLLSNGSNVDVSAFRSALSLAIGGNAVFGTAQVISSISDGYRFSSGAKLALENAAGTLVYQLPTGGAGTVKLVDGDGNGITDAAAFLAALSGADITGDTFTGKVTVNPSAGSTVFGLIGAAGFETTITSNASAARSIATPNASGVFALVSAADGSIASTDIADSTALGRSLLTAASAAAARSAIGVNEDTEISYAFAVNSSPAATTIGVATTYYTAAATTFAINDAANFTVPSASACSIQYNGAATKKFKISIKCTIYMAESNKQASLAVGQNGAAYIPSEQKHFYDKVGLAQIGISAEAILTLANGDTVEAMIANDTDTTIVSLQRCTIIATPLS